MFSVCVCVRRADHPSKESYLLSLMKKLRKLSPVLQKREQTPKRGSNEEEKTNAVMYKKLCSIQKLNIHF
jgi:hypothetical protein